MSSESEDDYFETMNQVTPPRGSLLGKRPREKGGDDSASGTTPFSNRRRLTADSMNLDDVLALKSFALKIRLRSEQMGLLDDYVTVSGNLNINSSSAVANK